jgi:WD40 repeat protein
MTTSCLLAMLGALAHGQLWTPDASAAHENVPKGAVCRIGSTALNIGDTVSNVVFTQSTLYAEKHAFDAKTGEALAPLDLDGVFVRLSTSRTCATFLSNGTTLSMLALPSTKPRGTRKLHDGESYQDVIPADDCSSAVQWDRRSHCVNLFDAALQNAGEICPGKTDNAWVALSGDGKRIAVETSDGDIQVFGDRAKIATLKSKGRDNLLALSRDGAWLAFQNGDAVSLATLPAGTIAATIPTSNGRLWDLAFSATKLAILYSGDPSQAIKVVDFTGKQLFESTNLAVTRGLAWSPDGDRLTYSIERTLRVVDGTTGADLVAPHRLLAINAFDATAERVAIASHGHLTVWSTADCSLIAHVPNTDNVYRLASLDDAVIAATTGDKLLRVDLSTQKRLTVQRPDDVDLLAVAPNKSVLALAGEDKHKIIIQLRDPKTLKVLRALVVPKSGPIGGLVFSPDSKKLYMVAASGSANGDTPTGNTAVSTIDVASATITSRFVRPGAAQSYVLRLLDGGRTIAVDNETFTLAGKLLKSEPGFPVVHKRVDCDAQSCVVNAPDAAP